MNVLTTAHPAQGNLASLLAGETGAIRMTGFISEDTCETVLDALTPALLEPYARDRYPVEAYRFGPTLNEYREPGGLDDAYWGAAGEARSVWDAHLAHSHLRERLAARLGEVCGEPVSPMTLRGREVYWPIVRDISHGTLLHWDDIAREYPPGLFDQRIYDQLALNIFVRAPGRGGELRVWRREWEPADEAHRVAFGYSSELMRTAPDLTVLAERTDAILFRSRNYHDVLPSAAGKRIAVALFVGIADSGLVVWS